MYQRRGEIRKETKRGKLESLSGRILKGDKGLGEGGRENTAESEMAIRGKMKILTKLLPFLKCPALCHIIIIF